MSKMQSTIITFPHFSPAIITRVFSSNTLFVTQQITFLQQLRPTSFRGKGAASPHSRLPWSHPIPCFVDGRWIPKGSCGLDYTCGFIASIFGDLPVLPGLQLSTARLGHGSASEQFGTQVSFHFIHFFLAPYFGWKVRTWLGQTQFAKGSTPVCSSFFGSSSPIVEHQTYQDPW